MTWLVGIGFVLALLQGFLQVALSSRLFHLGGVKEISVSGSCQ